MTPMTMALSGMDALEKLGIPAEDGLSHDQSSAVRFADGGQWRLEIPSVEGPGAFREVLRAAELHRLTVHRISQGSGVMMQTDDEVSEMVSLGKQHGCEVCLFVGPRAAWDTGAQVRSPGGGIASGSVRGADQLRFALDDVLHGVALGVRSFLVADLGLLAALGELKALGDLPEDLILKVSVQLPVANPATAAVLVELGASTLNLPPDLSVGQIAAIRRAVDAPIDMYVEAPDDQGGTVRHYEIPDLVRVASPIYLKFTVRNSPGLYPAGEHMQPLVESLSRERVRRARLGLDILDRFMPDATMSPLPAGPQ